MRKKIFLLVLLLVSCFTVFGQTNSNKDTTAVNSLLDESKKLIGSDSAKAVNLAMQAKELAIKLNFPKGEAKELKNLGLVYYMKGMYVETLDYWNQSLKIFEDIKDDAGSANMLSNIGAIYFNQGADAKAREYSLKSLQLAETIKDTLRMITTLGNIGSIYHNKKDPKALDYLLKAIPLFKNNEPVTEYVGVTGNIGEIYYDNNENAKALEYFQKSIKANLDSSASAFSLNGIGKIYLRQGKFSETLRYHNIALNIEKKSDDKLQVVRSLRDISDVHGKQVNTALAIDFYNQAKKNAEQMDDVKVELKDLYKDMALAYSKKKDFENAFLYQSHYADIKDTLYNIETKKKLNQLQFDFELSKKEVEINLKEARIKSEKQARWGLTRSEERRVGKERRGRRSVCC